MSCSKWQNSECLVINQLCNCSIKNPHLNAENPACLSCKKEWDTIEPSVENPTNTILNIVNRVNNNVINQVISYTKSLSNYTVNNFQNTSDETYKKRLEICNNCENYNKNNNKCNICGCYMAGSVGFISKLRMAHESCPLNPPKWGPEIKNLEG